MEFGVWGWRMQSFRVGVYGSGVQGCENLETILMTPDIQRIGMGLGFEVGFEV